MAVIMSKQIVLPIVYKTPLELNSWEAISKASQEGVAPNLWGVGDTKWITINGQVGNTTFTNLEIQVYIIGHNHNIAFEGGNLIHFKIGKINNKQVSLTDSLIGSMSTKTGYFNMNTSTTNDGGWKSCHMRNTILGSNSNPINPTPNTLLAALPSDLREVMRPVTKYTDNLGEGPEDDEDYRHDQITATTEYLFLLAQFEHSGSPSYTNLAEQYFQKQYEYYSVGNSRLHYQYNSTSTRVETWTRSPSFTSRRHFAIQSRTGYNSSSNANDCAGISPAFCV